MRNAKILEARRPGDLLVTKNERGVISGDTLWL